MGRELARMLSLCGLLAFAGSSQGAEADSSTHDPGYRSYKLPTRLDDLFFYVEAAIGGEQPLNPILDTGASYTVISPELSRRLKTAGKLRDLPDRIGGTASRKRQKMDFVEIGPVSIGGFHAATETAIVLDLTMLSGLAGMPVDGVAGMSLFKDVVLVLDYPAKEVRIEPPGQALPAGVRTPDRKYHLHQPLP